MLSLQPDLAGLRRPPLRKTKLGAFCAAWVLLSISATVTGHSQIQPSSPTSNPIKAEELQLYANARPYPDQPSEQLKKTVHELRDLTPSSSQDQLPGILAKTAAEADELLHKLPDLISDEAVSEIQWSVPHSDVAGCIGDGCEQYSTGRRAEKNQKFSYIILAHRNQYGQLQLDEYRAGRNGKPIPGGSAGPRFQGFIETWLVFSSLNQAESRFRYLGAEKTDGHDTFVVGFEQIPGEVIYPGQYQSQQHSVPMLLQGIAWIDQSDFRIVRLRTDLLAPLPQVNLQAQTSNIMFGPVNVAGSELWLPATVDIAMQAEGQFLQEKHRYSQYRLYQAKSRIILPSDN